MGKRKIEMKKIENKERRQVCFSKRRQGLFKKASELCILSDAEIAILAFSPAGKPFVFGHPSADTVISHYLTGTFPSTSLPQLPLVDYVNDLEQQLAAEEERAKRLNMHNESQFWWDLTNVEEVTDEENLKCLQSALEKVRETALARLKLKERPTFRLEESSGDIFNLPPLGWGSIC